MSDEPCVYRLHSTLELPLEDVHDLIDEMSFPDDIEDVDITRRNNTLILQAETDSEEVSKYTPTAQLKASISENRVYEEDPEEVRRENGGPGWGMDEEEEIESELVEFAGFKGDRETVLQNTLLQYEMFQVLYEIATHAEKGTLTAVTACEGNLEAWRIVDGEERAASVEVVEGPADEDNSKEGVDWRDNKFIS